MSLATAAAANPEQIAYWNGAVGASWARLQGRLDRQIEPLGELAMAALAPVPGERLIDIGCGCGQTTLALASAVGSTGEVVGVDVSAPMLAIAAARPRGADLAPVRFIEADAQVFAFLPARADGAFSRFGVMFFADPIAAFANVRAGLREGGRLTFVCWREMALNLFMTLPFLAAAPLLPPQPPPPDPYAPGPFAFADEGRLREILGAAGFSAVKLVPHDASIGGWTIDDTLEVALHIGPLGRTLRESPALVPSVSEAVRKALAGYATDGGVFLPSASWVVSASNTSAASPGH